MNRSPLEVIPEVVAKAVQSEDYWFLIGGQAVRCLVPYRPSHDVDFGVSKPSQLKRLLGRLELAGQVDLIERSADTIHLTFEGVDISIFLLPELAAHAENQALTVNGLLATKAHAILDRGTRRDFFDLYVLLETYRMGLSDVLRSLTEVYGEAVNQGLMLRALGYFEDAAAEAPLPGEGRGDFKVVQEFSDAQLGATGGEVGTREAGSGRLVAVGSVVARLGPARRESSESLEISGLPLSGAARALSFGGGLLL